MIKNNIKIFLLIIVFVLFNSYILGYNHTQSVLKVSYKTSRKYTNVKEVKGLRYIHVKSKNNRQYLLFLNKSQGFSPDALSKKNKFIINLFLKANNKNINNIEEYKRLNIEKYMSMNKYKIWKHTYIIITHDRKGNAIKTYYYDYSITLYDKNINNYIDLQIFINKKITPLTLEEKIEEININNSSKQLEELSKNENPLIRCKTAKIIIKKYRYYLKQKKGGFISKFNKKLLKCLKKLSNDESEIVRVSVASTGSCLRKYKTDKSWLVRVEVVKQDKKNKYIKELLKDEKWQVRYAIAEKGEFINILKEDKDIRVRNKALGLPIPKENLEIDDGFNNIIVQEIKNDKL